MSFSPARLLVALLVGFLLALAGPAEAAKKSRSSSAGYCAISQRCAYITLDASSGTVLEAMDADKKVYPASLTKMMTAYLLFEAIESGRVNLSDRVMVSAHAASQPALKLGLRAGSSISIEDALEAVTVRSANDAAVIVAEAVAGSEDAFARRMTRRAHELGMNHTEFRNASGLPDPGQITTARDMARLAQRVLADYPRYRRYFGMTSAQVAGRTIEGHNNLLKTGAVAGGKTGYIRDSGYNLVAWTERDGRLLIGSIFGGRTAAARDARLAALFSNAGGPERNAGQLATASGQQIPLPRRRPETVGDIINAATLPATSGLAEAIAVTSPAIAANLPGHVVEIEPAGLAAEPMPTFASSWAIQVGAYRDAVQAHQAMQAATRALPALLGTAYPRTLPTTTSVGNLFRAQIAGLGEQEARQACLVLTRQGMQCLSMPPNGRPS